MIQPKQPKKIKGYRKKERDKFVDNMIEKFGMYFEGMDRKRIIKICNAFKLSRRPSEDFPSFLIDWEMNEEDK